MKHLFCHPERAARSAASRGIPLNFVRFGLIAGVFLISAVSVSAFHNVQPGQHCIELNGESDDVPNNPNSGWFNYDDTVSLFPDHAGCIETEPEENLDISTPEYSLFEPTYVYDFYGSFWNTNVGWISTRCVGNKNTYETTGFDCGGIDYISWVDQEGYLHGWWWGEGAGWVRLDWWCQEGGPTSGTPFKAAGSCANSDANGIAGVPRVDPDDESTHGTVHGFVWSHVLGWISIEPSRACVNNDPAHCWHVSKLSFDLEIWTNMNDLSAHETDNHLDVLRYGDAAYPFANGAVDGTSKWYMTLFLKDPTGAVINDPNDRNFESPITVVPTWASETVWKNQIDNNGGNAVSGAGVAAPEGQFVYKSNISSVAPTTNVNGIYDSTIDDFTHLFDKRPPLSVEHEQCLQSVRLELDHRIDTLDFDETYNFVSSCSGYKGSTAMMRSDGTPYSDNLFEYVHLGNGDLTFKPRLEIIQLTSSSGPSPDYITAYRNQPFPVEVKPTKLDSTLLDTTKVGITAGPRPGSNKLGYILDYNPPDQAFQFNDLDDDNNCLPEPDSALPDVPISAELSTFTKALSDFGGGPTPFDLFETEVFVHWQEDENCGTDPTLDQPQIVTHVEEDNGTVKYYARYMPLSAFVGTANPVVDVEGSVSVSGEVIARGDSPTASIGNVTVSETREQILRNVRALTKNANPESDVTLRVNGGEFEDVLVLADYFEVGGSRVWYVQDGDVIINQDANPIGGPLSPCINWDQETTLIVEGGNVYIRGQLCTNSAKGLGIIALRKPGQQRHEAGNVCVDVNVTDAQANVFADGGFFRCTSAYIFNGGEYPELIQNRPDILKNQFYFEGSLSGRFTIGGVDSRLNGYGEEMDFSLPKKLDEATAYDLNYFAYYTLSEVSDADGNFINNVPSGDCAKEFSSPPDCTNPSGKIGSVYFVYKQVSATQPGFSSAGSVGASDVVR